MIWAPLILALFQGTRSSIKELITCSKRSKCQSELIKIIDKNTIRCPKFEELINSKSDKFMEDIKQECINLANKIHLDNIEFLLVNDDKKVTTDFFLFALLQDRKLPDDLMAISVKYISIDSLELYFVSLIDKLSKQKKLKTIISLLKIVKNDLETVDPNKRIAEILTRDCRGLYKEPISAIGVKLLEQTLVTFISQKHNCAEVKTKILNEIFALNEDDVYINLFMEHLEFKAGSTAYAAMMKTDLRYLCGIYGTSETLYMNMKNKDTNWIQYCYQWILSKEPGVDGNFYFLANLLEFNRKYNNPLHLNVNVFDTRVYEEVVNSHNEVGLFAISGAKPNMMLANSIRQGKEEQIYWLSKLLINSFSAWKQMALLKAFELKDRFAVYVINTKLDEFRSSNIDKTIYEMATTTKHIGTALKYSLLLENKPTDISCSICLSEIENPYNLEYTKCGHHFHATCLNGWVKSTCPLCRHENYRESMY